MLPLHWLVEEIALEQCRSLVCVIRPRCAVSTLRHGGQAQSMRETQDCDGNGLVIGFSSDAVRSWVASIFSSAIGGRLRQDSDE